MPDHSALIAELRAAAVGSPDLDLKMGKALGTVHADAELHYHDPETGGWCWITPARREWDAQSAADALARYKLEDPGEPLAFPDELDGHDGYLDPVSRSLDALDAYLTEKRGYVFRLLTDYGGLRRATVTREGRDLAEHICACTEDGETLPLAVCAALLQVAP